MKIVKTYKEIPLPCKIDARGEDYAKVERILLKLGFRWKGGEDPWLEEVEWGEVLHRPKRQKISKEQ